MAYNMTTWQKGDVIDSERLNKIEKGLTAAIAGLEAITGMTYDAQYFNDFQPNKLNVTGDSEIKGSLRLVQNTGTTPKTNPCIELDTYNGVPSGTARIWYAGANSQTDTYGTNTLIIGETKNVNLAAADITGVNLTATGGLTVSSTAALNGTATVGSTLVVTGKATLNDELEVVKDTAIDGTLTVGTTDNNKNTTLNGTLNVNGKSNTSTVKGNLIVGTEPASVGGTSNSLTVNGLLSTTKRVTVGTNLLVGKASDANNLQQYCKIYGKLTVSGETLIENLLKVTGGITIQSGGFTLAGFAQLNDGLDVVGETALKNNVTIGSDPVNDAYQKALTVKANSTLHGTTTIDQLVAANITGNATIGGTAAITSGLTIGSQDTTAQPYYTIADFNTNNIYLSKPVSFFNNSTRNEFIQVTSRDITQSIDGSNFSLINFRTTTTNNTASHSIYFGSSDTNTFIDGDTVTLVSNDLEFTVNRQYTYRFIGDSYGFGLSGIYEGSTETTKPDHALFRYSHQETQQQDMMIIGGKYNSVETTDSSLVHTTFINAKANVVLQTQNNGGILMQNNTKIQHGNFTINEGEFIMGDTHLTEQDLIALKALLNSNS